MLKVGTPLRKARPNHQNLVGFSQLTLARRGVVLTQENPPPASTLTGGSNFCVGWLPPPPVKHIIRRGEGEYRLALEYRLGTHQSLPE
jgi:hypothetical protein